MPQEDAEEAQEDAQEDDEEAQEEAQEDEEEATAGGSASSSTPSVYLRGPASLPQRPIPRERRPLIRPEGEK